MRFVRVDKNAGTVGSEPLFSARLRFEGEVGLNDISGTLPGQDAVELISEWLRKNPAIVVEIEERYRRIKGVGKRLLKRRAGRL